MADRRRTPQREAIRRVLRAARRPLSPSEILDGARRSQPGLGQATVYRNVARLVDDGWLHVVELPGTPDRYEVAGGEHHHHFHCRACDRVYDVDGCANVDALSPSGFETEAHEIILYGLCGACATTTSVASETSAASPD